MPHYVGLDVSQKTTAICVVDERGQRLWRGECTTEPGAIAARVFKHAGVDAKVGIETGSMTPWLVHGMRGTGYRVAAQSEGSRSTGSRVAGGNCSFTFVKQ
jgi:transposase